MQPRLFLSTLGFLGFLWLFTHPALAYIPHLNPKEGLFIRQFSYLFFLVAMFFFYFELNQEKLKKYRGLRFLSWASLLFALWNLDCFIGQFLTLNLDVSPVLGSAGSLTQQVPMPNILNWFYYITKLDNLLLVPAFYLFYLGLKVFSQEYSMD
jgi:hypothetical protein